MARDKKGFVFWQPPLAADRLSNPRRWVLSERALSHVAAYKYIAGPSTPLDRLMNHWWNFSVHLLPLWIAPNLVTLLGLLFTVAAAVVVVARSPNLTDALAPEVLYFCAMCLFLYQTLDAIDGKQARRTGSSSPLGQLFDHGCDALNTVLITIVLAAAWRLGDSPWLTLNLLFQVFVAFFMGQWEEYHTGMMRTNNGYVGVTEGQVLQMGIEVLTGIFGHGLWEVEVPVLGPWLARHVVSPAGFDGMVVSVKVVFMAWATLLTLWISVGSMSRVFGFKMSEMDPDEIGDKTMGIRASLRQLVPVLLSLVLGVMWTVGHGHEAFRDHAVAVMAALGLTMAYLSTRMTVCHMAKQPFGQAELVLPILLQLACVVNTHWLVVFTEPQEAAASTKWSYFRPLDDRVALWCYLWAMSAVYLHYTLGVIHDICTYLNIYCLRLPPKSKGT